MPIKNLKRNFVTGLQVVGEAVVKPLKWAGGQIEKEMKMNKKKDDKYRKEGRALNAAYTQQQIDNYHSTRGR